jgi:hypothetical protein
MIRPRRAALVRRTFGALRRARGEDGSTIVEFAFAFLLYATVVMGAIQVAIWAYTVSAAQFAVWEGCRIGASVYQPAPPDGTDPSSLPEQGTDSEDYAIKASLAATIRTEDILNWLPITSSYADLAAAVEEADVAPGEEGERDMMVTVRVKPFLFVPMFASLLADPSSKDYGFTRSCRLRLTRFYSF